MVLMDDLASKIFGAMKGFGHQIKLYTEDGNETVDPAEARRFFSTEDGLMVTIDEENNEVQLSKSDAESIDDTRKLQRNIKKLANEFLMNYTVRTYGKSIQPRDFSYKAKIHRNNNMTNEGNQEMNEISTDMKKRYYDAADKYIYTAGGGLKPASKKASAAKKKLGKASKAMFNRNKKMASATDELTVANAQVDNIIKKHETRAAKMRRVGRDGQGHKKVANEQIHKVNAMKNVAEGISRLTGSKKTSNQTLENVKILVKHKKEVDEDVRGSRSRNIQAIFLEQHGERLRFPHNDLNGARAMARHMSEGGNMTDKVGAYIIESVGHLRQLNEFLRYARTNKLVTEDTSDIVQTVRENVNSIRTELKRICGVKTYESIRSRIEEQEETELQESDIDSLRDMFTVKRYDEKFDAVLPIVNRLVQEKTQFLRRIEEAANQTIYVGPQLNNIDAIFEFANDEAKLGHRVSELASRVVENAELASYVSNVGQKLCKEGKISAFEQEIVSHVLQNVRPQPVVEKQTVQESQQFEDFYDKYLYAFV